MVLAYNNPMKKQSTSWGTVADWYQELLEENSDTYHQKVILPNLLRLLGLEKHNHVLDLACGQGFFAKEFVKTGARVIGADIAPELIQLAKKNASGVVFHTACANRLEFLKPGEVDTITLVLAIQNIENVHEVLQECARVLKPNGRLFVVMNHPVFRIPKSSGWGWDEKEKVQYRRIDRYLSEAKTKITMHPGSNPGKYTLTFHRSLQFYFKAFAKAGFAVQRLEEWISHKKSEPGPRTEAEDQARKEIPLFLCLEVVKKFENI